MTSPAALNLPAMSSPRQLADLIGLSESTVRRCIRLTKKSDKGWSPLPAKRLPDGQLRITAEAAAEWIANLPDA